MRLNNKGFTLIEVLAVVVIIAILGTIAAVSTTRSLNASKQSSYNIMLSSINTGAKQLFEEIDNGASIYEYTSDGTELSTKVSKNGSINNGNGTSTISVNLQTLLSNGYITGTNTNGKEIKVIINPKNNKDIGSCIILIKKSVTNYKVNYSVANSSTSNSNCPTTSDYEKK